MDVKRSEPTRPSLNFDRVAERYDETRGGERRGRQFAGDLAQLLDKDKLAVEIGVGTGVIALGLKEHGFRVRGLDISELMLARAKQRLGSNVLVRANAEHLPLLTGSVEQAFSVWVLHAVGDVGAVLREVARVLRPGGRYLVMDGRFFQKYADDHDPVIAAWREISAGLGKPAPINRAQQWAQLAPPCGLRVVDTLMTGPYEFEESIAEVAHNIETRANSLLWDVSDDDWERVVAPVIARLRAIPGAEEPIVHEDQQDVLVLERAAT